MKVILKQPDNKPAAVFKLDGSTYEPSCVLLGGAYTPKKSTMLTEVRSESQRETTPPG